MSGMGLLDRLMRGSVDRALRMQPGRTQEVADEYLYAAPSARAEVEAIRRAGRHLAGTGLAVAGLGVVAVRRSELSAGVTRPQADLAALDHRDLETVRLDARRRTGSIGSEVLLDLLSDGAGAAVWGQPVGLLALAALGLLPDPVAAPGLAEAAGAILQEGTVSAGVRIVPGAGAAGSGHDPLEAVMRLEAAERLAAITLAARR